MQLKHIFFLLLIAGFAACSGGGNKFHVKGNLANMPEQTVYLAEMGIDKITIIDSVKSDKAGAFSLAGNSPEPMLYRIAFSGNHDKFVIFSTEKTDVGVNGDWNAIEDVKFSNSPSSESLSKFLFQVRNNMRDFRTMGMVMDSMKAKGNDSMLAIAQNDLKEMNFQLTRYIEQYADSTKSLPNAIFAAQILNPANEKEYYKVFLQNMNARFPNARLAKEFTAKFNSMFGAELPSDGPSIGSMAPELTLTSTDGKQVTLSSLKGKYVLLDFWASWCGPCRKENPNIVAAYSKFKDKNFTIFGVSLDNDKDKWMEAIAKDGITWMQASDLKGWESAAARVYNIQSIPANFLIDPQGKIVARDLRGSDLESALAEMVK